MADPEFRICVFHHEHKSRLERTEKDVQNIWTAIDGMRRWVIAGSASTIIFFAGIIVQIVIKIMEH